MNATNTTNTGIDASLLAMLGAGAQAAEALPVMEGGFVVGVPSDSESKPKAASFEELLKTLNLDQTQTSKKSVKEGLTKEQPLVETALKKKSALEGSSKEEMAAMQAMLAGQNRVPLPNELVKDLKNEGQVRKLAPAAEFKILNGLEPIAELSAKDLASVNVKNKAELMAMKKLNEKNEFLLADSAPLLTDRNMQEILGSQVRANRNPLMMPNSEMSSGGTLGMSADLAMMPSDRFMIDSSARSALLQNTPLVSTEDYVFNREALKKSIDGKTIEESKTIPDFSSTNSQNSTNWNMSASLFKPESHVALGTAGLAKNSLGVSGSDALATSNAAPLQLNNAQALASQVQALARNGGGAVKVQANPESLGEVTIMVQTKGKRLEIQFETSTQEAREALQSNARQLKETLEAKQFEVAQISVQEKRESSVVSNSTQTMSTLLSGAGFLEGLRENNRSDFQNSGQNSNQNSEGWPEGSKEMTQGRGQGRGYQESNGNRSKGYQRYLDQYGMSA